MKLNQSACRLTQMLVAGLVASQLTLNLACATPYASCISNNAGTITFHLNESGGNVTIIYNDGTTNAGYNGITTGTNLPEGAYTFSLGGHASYSIAVSKEGTGFTTISTNSFILGDLRGIDVNKNPASPYFGRIYFDRSNPTAPASYFYALNSDFTFISSNSAGVPWVSGDTGSPFRMSIAPDDYLMVGDYSYSGAAVYRIAPDLSTNELFLGPVGDSAGTLAGVHGEEYSRPVLAGSLANGGKATLFIIDGDFPDDQPNSILIYSNITEAALPWQNPPDVVGAEVGLNSQYLGNVFPGLTRGTNGYFYASNYRINYSTANLQVYDATGTNLLWASWYPTNAPTADYFVSDVGGGLQGLVDSAVSPDDRFIVGLHYDNHLTICSLTNGIPDVSTLYTVTPPSFSRQAYGVCWDAADNIYTINSHNVFYVQSWTLGRSATVVTSGNANGSTGINATFPNSSVNVSTTNAFISQANAYGNPTNSSFTINRAGGNASLPLTVNFTYGGTAANGTYTAGATGSITFAPGQISTNIAIAAVTDGIARPGTTVILTLSAAPNQYSIGMGTAVINIANTAPDKLVASVGVPSMYNAFPEDYASIVITRWGDTNAATFTANTFTLSGTAVEGMDYTPLTPVTFNPGDQTQTIYVSPLINGQVPVDTNNLAYTGNKTILASVPGGPGYGGSTNAAVLTIIDSANPTATVLFADSLADAADAANWAVTSANNNMQNNAIDDYINFGYDLYDDPSDPFVIFGFPAVPIPFPPSGATNALRLTVNKTQPDGSGAAAGVNLYPTNAMFSGNYAVRFNMNLVEGYIGGYTTEGALFGINHTGKATNWWTGSDLLSGWGPGDSTEWESDGIWFWISADGGTSFGDFVELTGLSNSLPNTGWQELNTTTRASFVNEFKRNIFTSDGGPGLAANGSPDVSADINSYEGINSWSDVEIKQFNNVVTLSIDKTPVFVFTNTTSFTNGMLMLGYEDPFSSVGGGDAAVYYSNLRVVQLTPPLISETANNQPAGTFVFDFTTTDGELTTSSFLVQGSPVANGSYNDIPNATITQLGSGAFQAAVPENNSIQFYRIRE